MIAMFQRMHTARDRGWGEQLAVRRYSWFSCMWKLVGNMNTLFVSGAIILAVLIPSMSYVKTCSTEEMVR